MPLPAPTSLPVLGPDFCPPPLREGFADKRRCEWNQWKKTPWVIWKVRANFPSHESRTALAHTHIPFLPRVERGVPGKVVLTHTAEGAAAFWVWGHDGQDAVGGAWGQKGKSFVTNPKGVSCLCPRPLILSHQQAENPQCTRDWTSDSRGQEGEVWSAGPSVRCFWLASCHPPALETDLCIGRGDLESVNWLLVGIPEENLSKGATGPRLNRVQRVPTDFYQYDSGFHAEGSRA